MLVNFAITVFFNLALLLARCSLSLVIVSLSWRCRDVIGGDGLLSVDATVRWVEEYHMHAVS